MKLLSKTGDLSEMFGRDSKKAACVSSAKIFCSVQFCGQGPGLSSKCLSALRRQKGRIETTKFSCDT